MKRELIFLIEEGDKRFEIYSDCSLSGFGPDAQVTHNGYGHKLKYFLACQHLISQEIDALSSVAASLKRSICGSP